jgi:molybdopterin synthase sulfur carrier subunit
MSVPVRIPTPLRKLTENQEIVEVDGVTIRDVIENLEKAYPGLKERICDEENNIRRFVNVFVNDEDIRFLQEAATKVKPGDGFAVYGWPLAVCSLRLFFRLMVR